MPIRTEHYFLEAFLDGDAYLAVADKRRFSTIDNQLNRASEIIGDGRIEGWEITPHVFPNILVTLGNGLIDKFYVNTFGDKILELSESGTFYVYAQRRVGIIGVEGPKADIVSIGYVDAGPPNDVSNFEAELGAESSTPYFFDVVLTWDANTENDLSHYELERSDNSGDFELIDVNIGSTLTSYQDSVPENGTYDYRFYAVDLSGNRSVNPATGTVVAPLSSAIPQNPIQILTPQSEGAINILWKRPPAIPFSQIQYYKLTCVELNSDGSERTSTTQVRIISRLAYNDRIDDLITGQQYKVTLQTVDIQDRISSGYTANITPQPNPAPRDPQGIAYSMTESGDGVVVNLSWTDGDTPYDPSISFRYKIYTTIDGQNESLGLDVPIGFTEEQVSLYTYDLLQYFPIPEDKLVTFRITAIDEAGFESYGAYVRLVTSIFSLPMRLANLQAEFNSGTQSIRITWDNQSDTRDVRIVISNESQEDEYGSPTVIIDEHLGLTEIYVLENVELDQRYIIEVTPYNSDGVAGETTATVELTSTNNDLPLPEPPTAIEVKTNDRQIILSWNGSSTSYTTTFNLYRRTGDITFSASDWELIDTMPSSILRFSDYGLNNDTLYSYYITATDIYGRESLHLSDGAINLNFVQGIPRREGILTEPTNVALNIISGVVTVTWDSLAEEFDGFTIYRSVNNLYSWEAIATVDKETFLYTDIALPLIDGTTFYYTIDKTIDDAEIFAQSTNIQPANSILLGRVDTSDLLTSEHSIDVSDRRDIKDMIDPLAEYTNRLLLPHRHREILPGDPSRIDLNPELIVTDWSTVDGRIFTTTETDINGSSFILKVDGRFPSVFFSIDPIRRQIVFSEPIATFDTQTGTVIGDIPDIELKVFGVEEVQSQLDTYRFDNLHARQVQFGVLNREQLPEINHEGRIRETLFPDRFLLERYNNRTFIVPQSNTDDTKNFGDGTTFYATTEADGKIHEVIDWDLQEDDAVVGFQKPSFSTTTVLNIKTTPDIAKVTSDPSGFQSEKAYDISFEFRDDDPTRWVRITTFDSPTKPNPVLELTKRLRFRYYMETGYSLYLTLGIREISGSNHTIGSDGGTSGPIEWVGINSIATNTSGEEAPVGIKIEGTGEWEEVDIDLKTAPVMAFVNGGGNGILNKVGYGVLEHLALTIDPDSDNPTGPFYLRIDKLEQVSDLLVAGTSRGILTSQDFGTTWELARLTDTPVHKFYRARNNRFIWAISASEVLLATDPAFWFTTQGTTGIEYIRDITDDSDGNIFISTDKGVYWLEVSLLGSFSVFRQTQPINAFSTDAFAIYHNGLSSGADEIWVSTEIGIYLTSDFGVTWQDSGLDTSGLVAFQIINIGTSSQPILIAATRKHILRKLYNESQFRVIANFEDQHNIFDIWKIAYFDGRLYVSTGKGVYSNSLDLLLTPGIFVVPFDRVLESLDFNGFTQIAFGLDVIDLGDIGSRLMIGLENRLAQVKEDNSVSFKSIFQNKELPSFYIDNQEVTIGYIYNTFNNVLCFRENILVNKIATAAHIPRRSFFAKNGGWSHTNPDADVFIYKNGFPTWLDFDFDTNAILGEMQLLDGKLRTTENLTTFNSLLPTSQELLNTLLTDISNIRTGGENSAPLINDATIIKFVDDYTRFLSVVTEAYANRNELAPIQLLRTGISRSQRAAGSRAALLEQKEDFTAEDSTGIKIDIVTGEVDFATAFSNATNPEDRNRFTFDKFDHMDATIFNTNVNVTGEFTHREIEDQMESINTGLTSDLARTSYTNLIKSGIFLEQQHNYLFDRYNVSNIQSKFYAAYTNEWYDILNSTVDYRLITKVDGLPELRFANVALLLDQDPYVNNKIWIGTDDDIVQFGFDNNDELVLENFIRIDPLSSFFIWDIWNDGDTIYAVAADQETGSGKIFTTVNFGLTWAEETSINLPNQVYSFRIINGNRVATTENGVFYCNNSFGTYSKSSVVLSDNLPDNSPAGTSFFKPIFNIVKSSFVVVESERWFYTSGQGIEFFALAGQLTLNSASVVNVAIRHKNLTWVGTDKGLYNDGNSLLSDSVQWGLQTEMEDTISKSAALQINALASGVDALYVGAANGKIYRYLDETPNDGVGNEWKGYLVPDFGPIHKLVLIEDINRLVVISYNKIRALDISIDNGVFV